MIAALPYVVIAVLVIVVAALLARERRTSEAGEDVPAGEYRVDHPGNGQFQKLADRIFDPSDFLWLRDTVGRADLARQLASTRKNLAIQWLRCLRRSFDQIVCTPEPVPLPHPANPAMESWRLLWLTARFQLLLGYALFVVHTLGPYHRLLPTLGWHRFLPQPASPKTRYSIVP